MSSSPPQSVPPGGDAQSVAAGRIVGRNVLALVLSQFVTTPISIVLNAVLARKLGVSNFGAIYLATTVLAVAFLFVDWGGMGQVAAEIARDHASAPRIFGTGIMMRVALAAVVLLVMPRFAAWMAYDAPVVLAVKLLGVRYAIASLGNLCNSVLRGFERINWQARATVAGTAIEAGLVIVTLLRGGDLRAALIAQVAGVSIALCVQLFLVSRLHIGRPRFDAAALRALVGGGAGFLFLELVLKMQPYIDAAFLSRLAASEALGWYSAASRIAGVLVFPALTLHMALYPTLARLWRHDRGTWDTMVRVGMRMVIVLGVMAATGTAIFAPLIVGIVYGSANYGPAASNLSVLSPYVFLVYSSILLGTALGSAAMQVRWALTQSFCLVVSVALDPVLIPWAQQKYGNGSLGVCISVVIAEVAMAGVGLRLTPLRSGRAELVRTLRRSLVAGAAMALAGFGLRGFPVLAIPVTVAAYGAVLWFQGELDAELIAMLRSVALSKLSRGRTGEPATAG